MKRETETYAQQSGRDHSNPGAKITVMHVDVIHAPSLQQYRVIRPKPRVQQGFCSDLGCFFPSHHDARD
jgi:hypothetical protein